MSKVTTGFYSSPQAMSSNDDTWTTPKDYFHKVDAEFGFGLDAAALESSALCSNWYGPDNPDPSKRDALAVDYWIHDSGGKPVWMNPPYGRDIKLFMAKANAEAAQRQASYEAAQRTAAALAAETAKQAAAVKAAQQKQNDQIALQQLAAKTAAQQTAAAKAAADLAAKQQAAQQAVADRAKLANQVASQVTSSGASCNGYWQGGRCVNNGQVAYSGGSPVNVMNQPTSTWAGAGKRQTCTLVYTYRAGRVVGSPQSVCTIS
jgi:phage N-6-adenine-methyltransferase